MNGAGTRAPTHRPAEISLRTCADIVLDRFRTVATVIVVSLVIAVLWSASITPQYMARSSLALALSYDDNVKYLAGGPEYADNLVRSCMTVAARPGVLGQAIGDSGALQPIDVVVPETEIRSQPQTGVIEVRVTDPSPTQAARLASAIASRAVAACNALRPEAPPGVDVFRFRTVGAASTPNSDVTPRWGLNLVTALVIGLVAGIALVIGLDHKRPLARRWGGGSGSISVIDAAPRWWTWRRVQQTRSTHPLSPVAETGDVRSILVASPHADALISAVTAVGRSFAATGVGSVHVMSDDRTDTLSDALREAFPRGDVVIVGAPALTTSSSAVALCGRVDAVVVAVHPHTPAAVVDDELAAAEAAGSPVCSLIVTR